MNEVWKPVAGYNGVYEVSSLGRVRALDRTVTDHNGVDYPVAGRLMRPSLRDGRYESIQLNSGGNPKSFLVHRLVAAAFVANPNGFTIVNHIDGDKTNNCALNLEWCTQQANCAHALTTGLYKPPKGSATFNSKLTEGDVIRIRGLYACGMKQRDIAEQFNICRANVSFIVNRRAWTHVP